MSTLALDISISLDGYAIGPNASFAAPMGIGGERLHAWAFGDDPTGVAGRGRQAWPSSCYRGERIHREGRRSSGARLQGRRGPGAWRQLPLVTSALAARLPA